ncbi:butyrate kinase [Mycoplasmatota bacterium]|nr:butyrate kinase [Mycoplasmatota bacterium]
MHKILAINPGSTSTKIGVFFDKEKVEEITLRHSKEELSKYKTLSSQFDFRKELIVASLEENNYDLNEFSAIACRGGIIKPISSGTYLVDENVVYDSKNSNTDHPSNLAALIGNELAKQYNLKAFITDPPVTFEGEEMATITGQPLTTRRMRFHALNHKAIAKKFCDDNNLDYSKVNLVVAHVGGGVSVGIHKNGVVVDVTDAMDEGPFSPERSGGIPVFQLADICFSGKYSHDEVKKLLRGNAGFNAYLGTNDAREVFKMIESGDELANVVYEAFVYQIAKEIAAMSVNVNGNVDAIIITGGIAYQEYFIKKIKERVEFIAKMHVYPGEMELEALAYGSLEVITGKTIAKIY